MTGAYLEQATKDAPPLTKINFGIYLEVNRPNYTKISGTMRKTVLLDNT